MTFYVKCVFSFPVRTLGIVFNVALCKALEMTCVRSPVWLWMHSSELCWRSDKRLNAVSRVAAAQWLVTNGESSEFQFLRCLGIFRNDFSETLLCSSSPDLGIDQSPSLETHQLWGESRLSPWGYSPTFLPQLEVALDRSPRQMSTCKYGTQVRPMFQLLLAILCLNKQRWPCKIWHPIRKCFWRKH